MIANNSTNGVRVRCFYSGTAGHPVYVDVLAPGGVGNPKLPIVMLHGGFHTGSGYLATPDGRAGWASFFAAKGHTVYVPDWPGHGRSPVGQDFAALSTRDIAQSMAVLLEDVGPAIIFAHSASGPIAWWLAAERPALVVAVVGIAPGPPANIQQPLPDDSEAIAKLRYDQAAGCPIYSPPSAPVWVDREFIRTFWASSPRFPHEAFEAYARSIVPESATVLNERFHIGGKGLSISSIEAFAARPVLIVTGELDPRHPRAVDASVAAFLGAKHLWLPDVGVLGNGHMLMLETNSDEIAELISEWLAKQSL